MEGWIKIYPKMTEWRWYRDTYTKALFLHLLLSANFKDTPYMKTTIRRGQVLTSVSRLSKELDIPAITIRRKLENLKGSGEIVTETTNKWTIITICNYDSYQDSTKTNEQANEQTNEQTHRIRNIDIYPPSLSKERVSPLTGGTPLPVRQKEFYDSLLPFLGKYEKHLLRDFYDYWSEPDRAAKPKMRYEKEKTWSLERRLERWKRIDDEKATKRTPQANKPSKLDQYKAQAQRLGLIDYDTDQSNSIDEQ